MKMARLADIATVNPRGDTVDPGEHVSFVGMAQLDAERALAEPLETRLFAEVSKGYTVFRDGDVLAAKITPCWENGKIGQARLEHKIGVGSTEFQVIRPGFELDERYLLHFLRQPTVRATGELRMTGSAGQRRVPATFLQSLRIPILSIDEQQRIAGILDQADAIRAKRRQLLDQLDALTQSIFHDMFGNIALDGNTVGSVASIQGGLQVSSKRAGLPVEVPYLRVANVYRGQLGLDDVKKINASEAEIQRTRLECGDLLFVEGHANPNEVGRVAIWKGGITDCVHQNHLIRGRLDTSKVLPEFAESWLNTDRGAAHFRRSGKTTSGLNTISATTVRSAPLPVPALDEQGRYAARVEQVNAQRAVVQRALEADNELFESLQARAFRGEL